MLSMPHRQWVQMKVSIQNSLSNQVRRQPVPVEDGVSRGHVESFLTTIRDSSLETLLQEARLDTGRMV